MSGPSSEVPGVIGSIGVGNVVTVRVAVSITLLKLADTGGSLTTQWIGLGLGLRLGLELGL